MCFKPKYAKFQQSSAREAFLILGLNEKRVRNFIENWPYLGNSKK